jgi:hypothetical protein
MSIKDEGTADTLNDRVGQLGRAIRSQPRFNKQAAQLKADLIRAATEVQYIEFTARTTIYGTWRIGESLLFNVPLNRRGALTVFRGKAIRVVCVGSGRYTRQLMAGVVA